MSKIPVKKKGIMMMGNKTRENIKGVLKHYQDCQLNGIKDVDRQMQIYSDDSVFVVFPLAGVVGMSDPLLLNGKQEIRNLMEQYNKLAGTFDSVRIINKELMVDPEALKGSFVMEITMTKAGETHQYLNYLQMQLNQDMQVIQSLNWQANATGSEVLKYV